MDAMVKLLIEKETINKDEVAEVFKSIKKVRIQGTGKNLRLA
jgi:ATP-dependent Zn protease